MTLTDLASGKYLLVTTYKKDGSSVPTPVWVVPDGDAIGIWTGADSWKVKRIRNRADVIVGPCDGRGHPTGPSIPATAELLDASGTARYRSLLAKKYGLIGHLTLLASKVRGSAPGRPIGVRITPTRMGSSGPKTT
jgi:PPOX class probable F420-dependent enzyme